MALRPRHLPTLYEKYKWIVGGSNDVSGFRQLLNFYTVRSGMIHGPPERDFFRVKVLDPETSKVTQTEVPWKIYVDPKCRADSIYQLDQAKLKIRNFPSGHQKRELFVNITKPRVMSHHLMKRELITKQGYIRIPSSGNGKYEL